MIETLSKILAIILKIKDLIEVLNQSQGAINNNIYNKYIVDLVDLIKQAKKHIMLYQGTDKILKALDNILIKIQNGNNSLSKIITDLQVIGNEISSIYTEEKEAVNTILNLIKTIKTLSLDLPKL